jgi:hypothetical protein
MKKAWEKPQLVILVRGKPAERVLGACKTSGASGDPQTEYLGCDEPIGVGADFIPVICQSCYDDYTS